MSLQLAVTKITCLAIINIAYNSELGQRDRHNNY